MAANIFVKVQKKCNFARVLTTFDNIKAQIVGAKCNVGLITLNRPHTLNALYDPLISEICTALNNFNANENIGAIVITGNKKVFAAGADVKEMLHKTYSDCLKGKVMAQLDELANVPKPFIAAVNGYALGGGCVLAMMCDVIFAGEKAIFGLPEILLGTIPAAGGMQRLARSVGKSKAMEIVLTGNQFSAIEAEYMGLVNKVFPTNQVLGEAIMTAEKIANSSQIATRAAKEAINAAYQTTLQQGLKAEYQMLDGLNIK